MFRLIIMLIIEVGAKTSSKYFSRKLPRLTYHKFRLVYAHFYRAHRLHFLINLKIFFYLVKNIKLQNVQFQNKHDVNNTHCSLTFTKHGNTYNSDARLLLSFYETDRDKTYFFLSFSLETKPYNKEKPIKIHSVVFM